MRMMKRKEHDKEAELENGHGTNSDCENIDPPCCCDETPPNCQDLLGMMEFAKTAPNPRGYEAAAIFLSRPDAHQSYVVGWKISTQSFLRARRQ